MCSSDLPLEGGVLELSGVFSGSPSVASSSAIRAVSCAFCSTNASIRAINAEIKASLSGGSDGSVTPQVDSYPGAPRNPEISASPRALSPARNRLSNYWKCVAWSVSAAKMEPLTKLPIQSQTIKQRRTESLLYSSGRPLRICDAQVATSSVSAEESQRARPER